MIFRCMTDRELERWLYANPEDEGAKAEAVSRADFGRVAELERELERLEDEAVDLNDRVSMLEQEVEELS